VKDGDICRIFFSPKIEPRNFGYNLASEDFTMSPASNISCCLGKKIASETPKATQTKHHPNPPKLQGFLLGEPEGDSGTFSGQTSRPPGRKDVVSEFRAYSGEL